MKLDRHYETVSEDEKLDNEMTDEIYEIIKWYKKYSNNIDSLLGKKRSKQVKKAILNVIIEEL